LPERLEALGEVLLDVGVGAIRALAEEVESVGVKVASACASPTLLGRGRRTGCTTNSFLGHTHVDGGGEKELVFIGFLRAGTGTVVLRYR
jgi:hypothetical protein